MISGLKAAGARFQFCPVLPCSMRFCQNEVHAEPHERLFKETNLRHHGERVKPLSQAVACFISENADMRPSNGPAPAIDDPVFDRGDRFTSRFRCASAERRSRSQGQKGNNRS